MCKCTRILGEWESDRWEKLGMLSYIHKQKEGRDIYFFTNSTDKPVDTWVTLRGKLDLEQWNPYKRKTGKCPYEFKKCSYN